MNDGREEIRLVVGLGNPGSEYDGTRHNVGFMVIDRLLAAFPAGRFEEKHVAESRVFTGNFRGRSLIWQKPLTFMNLSGNAVAPLARKLGIAPEAILVISDDLDLPLGRLRLPSSGCGSESGGRNPGKRSIMCSRSSRAATRRRLKRCWRHRLTRFARC